MVFVAFSGLSHNHWLAFSEIFEVVFLIVYGTSFIHVDFRINIAILNKHLPQHTGILAQDSFQPLFLHSCWQHWCQKKRNTSRNSNFWVWSATFHPGLKNSWKTVKVHKNQHFFDGFSKFIQFWLKSSGSNQQIWIPWCFLLLLIPMLTSEVEK